jgi:hypothetical protein
MDIPNEREKDMRIGKVRLKWVNSWQDKKTGIVYTKLRRPGFKDVALPNTIGSAEFIAAYAAAIRGAIAASAAQQVSSTSSVSACRPVFEVLAEPL